MDLDISKIRIRIMQVLGLESRLKSLEEGGGAGGNHAGLANLDYAHSGHTGFMPTTTIPDQLSDLTDDSTHRLVTDAEKAAWNAGGGESVKKTYTQSSHGFVAGNAVYRSSGTWVKGKADVAGTAEAEGVVESVAGNDFVLVESGEITGLSGGTDGSWGFLSKDTAGALTTTEPDPTLYVSKPILKWTSTTTGIVQIQRGIQTTDTVIAIADVTGLQTALDAKVAHSLATAENDVLVGAPTPFGSWVKKTLAEFQTILGLGSAAYTASTAYAPSANGVTGGDSHDHSGGDGAQIAYSTLGSIPSTFAPTTHAGAHVTGGGDIIANAIAAGNAGLMTGTDKTKLDGIASGAEVNVNADWSSVSGDSQILNKPATYAPSSHDNTAHSTAYLAATAFVGLSKITVSSSDPGGSDGDLWVQLP